VQLLNDLHHLTFITADMDRLIAFYQRIFEAKLLVDIEEDGLRHAFIEIGHNTVLHPFQIPNIQPPASQPMFQRGRLDHFALNAASEDAFIVLYRRLCDEGAVDGKVIDMGSLLLFNFVDPDGANLEVVWKKPDIPVNAVLKRADWTLIDL
jgi:catechol 2,3-dioxygenase-like lactoylglutathione lyase family enzyme